MFVTTGDLAAGCVDYIVECRSESELSPFCVTRAFVCHWQRSISKCTIVIIRLLNIFFWAHILWRLSRNGRRRAGLDTGHTRCLVVDLDVSLHGHLSKSFWVYIAVIGCHKTTCHTSFQLDWICTCHKRSTLSVNLWQVHDQLSYTIRNVHVVRTFKFTYYTLQ